MAEILPFRSRPRHLPPDINLTQVAILLDTYLDGFDATGLETPVPDPRSLGQILIRAGQALIDLADRQAPPDPGPTPAE